MESTDKTPAPAPASEVEAQPQALVGGAGNAAVAADWGDAEPESDMFMCFVCLDLIYKPVVLECGHMSCFWCIHKSMNGFKESKCAVCRRQYKHFPGICELLHQLLLKIEPAAYNRRAKEVYEEEKKINCFSPQFFECLEGKPDTNPILSASDKSTTVISHGVSITDVSCHGCKGLLFRPSVLNCGHVYCAACTVALPSDPIKCPTCQVLHPGVLPKPCLKLDEFLAKEFPEQCMQRTMCHDLKVKNNQNEASSSCTPAVESPSKKKHYWLNINDMDVLLDDEDLAHAHIGVGCDACGMLPITGKRYKCKDCTEAMGFDLCEACYETPSKRPGRFNQRHTPDHRFEIDDSHMLLNILKRRMNEGRTLSDYDTEDTLTSD